MKVILISIVNTHLIEPVFFHCGLLSLEEGAMCSISKCVTETNAYVLTIAMVSMTSEQGVWFLSRQLIIRCKVYPLRVEAFFLVACALLSAELFYLLPLLLFCTCPGAIAQWRSSVPDPAMSARRRKSRRCS